MTVYFDFPRLRSDITFKLESQLVTIAYLDCEYVFELEGAVSDEETKDVLVQLSQGRCLSTQYLTEAQQKCVNSLDDIGVIEESYTLSNGISSKKLLSDLEHLSRRLKNENGDTKFEEALKNGNLTFRAWTLWTFQYYFITHNAVGCVSPALMSFSGEAKAILENFIADEIGHDKLILKSLLALKLSQEVVEATTPLPQTSVLLSYLKHLANTSPWSLAFVLSIFEGTEEDGEYYLLALRSSGLPSEWIRPQEIHHEINVSGNHYNISRELFSTKSNFTDEEGEQIKAEVANLIIMTFQCQNAIIEAEEMEKQYVAL